MSLAAQDTSLAANLRRIAILTRDGGGAPLDPDGSIRLIHADADRVPLFWCFNAVSEFTDLAGALGPHQPLVGMRSLNKVVDPAVLNSPVADALATHYAAHLLHRFGTAPCIIGGNCQAAAITYRIALRLMAAKVPVLRLVTLDAEIRHPFPGHVRLLYGRDSALHNPFFQSPPSRELAPLRNWHHAFGGCDWAVIDGCHGAYFVPENVHALARAIMAPSPATKPPAPLALAAWRITQITQGHVTLQTAAPERADDFALLPVWRGKDGALVRTAGEDWLLPLVAGPQWTCRIPRPHGDGPWHLWPVLCRRDIGPLAWPIERHQRLILD